MKITWLALVPRKKKMLLKSGGDKETVAKTKLFVKQQQTKTETIYLEVINMSRVVQAC